MVGRKVKTPVQKNKKQSVEADSQEEVFHNVVVILTAAVRQVACREHDDGVQAFAIIT